VEEVREAIAVSSFFSPPRFPAMVSPTCLSTQLSSGLDSLMLCFICNLEVTKGCGLEARASASRLTQFFFEREDIGINIKLRKLLGRKA